MPYGSKLHIYIPPTNYYLLAAQQEPYIFFILNASLQKMLGAFSGGGGGGGGEDRRMTIRPSAEKRTRQKEQEDWAENPERRYERGLKWQPGDRDIRHPWPPFWEQTHGQLIMYYIIYRSLSIKKMNRTMLLYTALSEWTENFISSLSNLPCQRQHGQNWSLGLTPV